MTTETQLPKLSTLSPERRRILSAEGLGWTRIEWYEDNAGPPILHGFPPPTIGLGKSGEWDAKLPERSKHVPSPDLNANDALALIEHAAKEGWRYNLSDYKKGGHHVQFFRPDYSELYEIAEPTPMRALTSAFLLATNKAQL